MKTTTTQSLLLPFLLIISFFTLVSCGDSKEKKAVRALVQDITTNAQEVEVVGRALQTISVLEQAQGLTEKKQCKAARDIYCAMFQMVRDNCNDSVSFCQTVADGLYGGNFPVGGMRICTKIASDKCSELAGHKQKLHRICTQLRQQC